MTEFKECPKGHFYDSKSEECPYCNGQTIDDTLEKLPQEKSKFPIDSAMCYIMLPDY